MANSYVRYTATAGQTVFTFPFSYLQEAHIGCTRNPDSNTPETITDFTISSGTPNSLTVGGSITVAEGDVIEVRRTTPRDEASREVVFTQPSVIRADDLNTQGLQNLYIAQEAFDDASDADDKAETFQTAIALAQATADNAVAIAKSAGASATLNAAELARVQSGSAYGSDASEVQFKSLIGAHGWNGAHDGWQISENAYFTNGVSGTWRALGALRVPAYTLRHGGIIRCEIWGEMLNADVPTVGIAGPNMSLRVTKDEYQPGTETNVLCTAGVYQDNPSQANSSFGALTPDVQNPFHIKVDIIPCGRYKTQIVMESQIGDNTWMRNQYEAVPSSSLADLADHVETRWKILRQWYNRNHITTQHPEQTGSYPGSSEYTPGTLDGTYPQALITASANPLTGDIITVKDATVAAPNYTIGFGTSGESIDVTIGASLSDTLDNLEEEIAKSPLRLFTIRNGNNVYISPPYASPTEYGATNLSAAVTTLIGGSTLSVTDFSANDDDGKPGADNGKLDWQTDQDFYFHLNSIGMHTWVYNIQAYQIGGTKGWEAPLR